MKLLNLIAISLCFLVSTHITAMGDKPNLSRSEQIAQDISQMIKPWSVQKKQEERKKAREEQAQKEHSDC
jgi:hypothetical protein